MNVYKLLMSQNWDKFIAIVAANSEEEAKRMFTGVEEVELIPGLTFDPNAERKPVTFDLDGKPLTNVLVYEWFPAH